MKILLTYGWCLGLLFTQISCQKNVQDDVIEVISGNVGYANFVKSSADNYFVLDQNKIRFLNTSAPNGLNISSTLPFTDNSFEIVRGNSDTLYIQQPTGLHLYVRVSDATIRWEEKAVIQNILPCDKFNVRYPFLLTSVGNTSCNFSRTPTELRLYDISDMANPSLKSILGVTSVSQIELATISNGFYVATADGQLNAISISADSTAATKIILNQPLLNTFTVSGSKLLTKSTAEISQYNLSTAENAQLLSKIPIAQ